MTSMLDYHAHTQRDLLNHHLEEIIERRQIRPFFQPIIDLFSGSIIGYEVLSRGTPPLENPQAMFQRAKSMNLLWELERACREAAFRVISQLPGEFRSSRFFLNVSPDIFSDQRFVSGFTLSAVNEYGLDQRNIVIEITEEASFYDYLQVEKLVGHYVNQGFAVALDDFGAGYSSLATLIAVNPQYIKLDKLVVRDIDKHAYKQQLVKSIVSFANSVEGHLIAEGVETWSELELLIRMGVRYAQGFLFARPAPEPSHLSEHARRETARLVGKFNYPRADLNETISNLVVSPCKVEANSMTCEAIDRRFKQERRLDHIVLVKGRTPAGLVTRQHFYSSTGGPFGYTLVQKKPVDMVAKRAPLVVGDKIHITTLAKLAMERLPEDLYDPVLVIDSDGHLLGTVTIKQLVGRASELEIKNAMGANPLTNLPGNRTILKWVQDAIATPPFTVIYADLDRFKEFNDAYGFLMGDEMIRLAASVMTEALPSFETNARLGHVGGDDFVIVINDLVRDAPLRRICERFDEQKKMLFREKDARRGWFESVDRQGTTIRVNLSTLSLAVIHSNNLQHDPHPSLLSQLAAGLKRKIKQINARVGASGFLIERRVYHE